MSRRTEYRSRDLLGGDGQGSFGGIYVGECMGSLAGQTSRLRGVVRERKRTSGNICPHSPQLSQHSALQDSRDATVA